jgi:hypothetical protein
LFAEASFLPRIPIGKRVHYPKADKLTPSSSTQTPFSTARRSDEAEDAMPEVLDEQSSSSSSSSPLPHHKMLDQAYFGQVFECFILIVYELSYLNR